MARKRPKNNGAVEKKLVGVADVVITAAQRSKDPTFSIPVRSLANVTFDEKKGLIEMGRRKQARSFFNVGMAKKFMQTVLVADALAELQRANLTTSLREIYYRTKHTMKGSHENTFDGQNESDPLIEDLEVALTALREELHVRAENAGSIVAAALFLDMKLSTIRALFESRTERRKLFVSLPFGKIATLAGLGPRYETAAKLAGLRAVFGADSAITLDQAAERVNKLNKKRSELVIVGYQYDRDRAKFFRSNPASLASGSGSSSWRRPPPTGPSCWCSSPPPTRPAPSTRGRRWRRSAAGRPAAACGC